METRHWGVSPEPWRSLNFSVLRGDVPWQGVRVNRRKLAEAVEQDAAHFVACRDSTDPAGVAKVDRSDAEHLRTTATHW